MDGCRGILGEDQAGGHESRFSGDTIRHFLVGMGVALPIVNGAYERERHRGAARKRNLHHLLSVTIKCFCTWSTLLGREHGERAEKPEDLAERSSRREHQEVRSVDATGRHRLVGGGLVYIRGSACFTNGEGYITEADSAPRLAIDVVAWRRDSCFVRALIFLARARKGRSGDVPRGAGWVRPRICYAVAGGKGAGKSLWAQAVRRAERCGAWLSHVPSLHKDWVKSADALSWKCPLEVIEVHVFRPLINQKPRGWDEVFFVVSDGKRMVECLRDGMEDAICRDTKLAKEWWTKFEKCGAGYRAFTFDILLRPKNQRAPCKVLWPDLPRPPTVCKRRPFQRVPTPRWSL